MAEVTVRVKVEGIREAVAALTRIERNARRRAVSAGVRAGNAVLTKRARSEAPIRSGALRKSIRASINMDRATGTVVGTVYAGKATKAMKKRGQTAYYAHMVHGGTKPHSIRARRGSALAIQGALVAKIQHPGARANPFFDRTVDGAYDATINAFTATFGAKVEEEVAKR